VDPNLQNGEVVRGQIPVLQRDLESVGLSKQSIIKTEPEEVKKDKRVDLQQTWFTKVKWR